MKLPQKLQKCNNYIGSFRQENGKSSKFQWSYSFNFPKQLLLREGFKNKKNKKYGIFHNRAGGVYPIPHFFFIFFLIVKWQFSVKFEGFFSVLPSNQTFNSITFHSIFEQPNNFEHHYTPFPWSQMLWNASKNNANFSQDVQKKS